MSSDEPARRGRQVSTARFPEPFLPLGGRRSRCVISGTSFCQSMHAHLVVAAGALGRPATCAEMRASTNCASNQHARSQVFRITTTFWTFPSTILFAHSTTQTVFWLIR
jgi:hypothetical protein